MDSSREWAYMVVFSNIPTTKNSNYRSRKISARGAKRIAKRTAQNYCALFYNIFCALWTVHSAHTAHFVITVNSAQSVPNRALRAAWNVDFFAFSGIRRSWLLLRPILARNHSGVQSGISDFSKLPFLRRSTVNLGKFRHRVTPP